MNRRYTTGEYYEKVKLLRNVYKNPAITTDVIVGFPGETDEEFDETKKYLEKIKFYEMHIFKYSKRKGTRAAVMDNQVQDTLKTIRSNVLLAMKEADSKEFRDIYIGKEVKVLFEEERMLDGQRYQTGHTEQYIKVAMKTETSLSNQLMSGKIIGFFQDDIMQIEPL